MITSEVFTDDTLLSRKFFLSEQQAVGLDSSSARYYSVPTRAFRRASLYRSPRRRLHYQLLRGGESYLQASTEILHYRRSSMIGDGFGSTSYLLRRYNVFFSDLTGFERKSQALGGVGVWGINYTPNDYFFR